MSLYNADQYLYPVKNSCDPLYDRDEKAIIDKYEDDYRSATTPATRRHIVVAQICPELFNYWVIECKITIDSIEEKNRVKDILAYVRNNWRPTKSTRQYQPTFKVKRSDVVWDTMKDEVMDEIALLMGLEQVSTSTRSWINHRSRAIGNIIDGMDEDTLVDLDAEVKRRMSQGNPEHLKPKLAAKYRFARISDANTRNYLEMGLLSMNFVAWKDEDGVWGIELHDGISAILNEDGATFEERNANTVEGWKRQMLVYLDQTLVRKEGTKSILPDTDVTNDGFEKYIEVDRATGFPRLKDTFRSFVKPKKKVEKLFRYYLTLQYSVAKGKKQSVPYTKLLNNISRFIGAEFMPPNFRLRNPRNVTANEIQSFFEHIYERQLFHPIENVFRFKNVTSTRNEGETIPAPYPPRGPSAPTASQDLASSRPDLSARTEPKNVGTNPKRKRQRKQREEGPNEITLDFNAMLTMPSHPNGDSQIPTPPMENTGPTIPQPVSVPSGHSTSPGMESQLHNNNNVLPGNNWEQEQVDDCSSRIEGEKRVKV